MRNPEVTPRGKPTENELAGCIGKAPYQSRALAWAVAERRTSRGKRSYVYKCPFCGLFHHAGGTDRRKRKMRRLRK